MVCDRLLRQDETSLGRRGTGASGGGKERTEVEYVRSRDAHISTASSFFTLAHAGKHFVEHDFKRPWHSDDCPIIFFYCQVKGNLARAR